MMQGRLQYRSSKKPRIAEQYDRNLTSWNTGSVLLSRGLTVFLFLISGSRSAPPVQVKSGQ